MTGRVDIVWRIFGKNAKNVENEVSVSKKHIFFADFAKHSEQLFFFGYCDFNFNFLHYSQNAPEYIDPSGNIIFYNNF